MLSTCPQDTGIESGDSKYATTAATEQVRSYSQAQKQKLYQFHHATAAGAMRFWRFNFYSVSLRSCVFVCVFVCVCVCVCARARVRACRVGSSMSRTGLAYCSSDAVNTTTSNRLPICASQQPSVKPAPHVLTTIAVNALLIAIARTVGEGGDDCTARRRRR